MAMFNYGLSVHGKPIEGVTLTTFSDVNEADMVEAIHEEHGGNEDEILANVNKNELRRRIARDGAVEVQPFPV